MSADQLVALLEPAARRGPMTVAALRHALTLPIENLSRWEGSQVREINELARALELAAGEIGEAELEHELGGLRTKLALAGGVETKGRKR